LRFVVDADQTEALGIALGPFEVVQERPGRVTSNVVAFGDGSVEGDEVVAQVFTTVEIDDLPIGIFVGVRGTVFGQAIERR